MARKAKVSSSIERTVRYSDGVLYQGDCLKIMKSLPPKSVDLVLGSPPYEDARTYGIGFNLKGQDWVDWMVEIFVASLHVCKGLVAFVVGHGKGARKWSGVPALLCADLLRKGINLRSPVWYKRNGIMGSGGNDWLRADMEWIICATKAKEKLPWSDNTACGHPPKFGAGGPPSHHEKNGRIRKKTGDRNLSAEQRKQLAELMETKGITKKQAATELGLGMRRPLRTWEGKEEAKGRWIKEIYLPPALSNPGNVIECDVGGGRMGSNINHDNEASFPEKIPDFFIRSFCKPQGIVLDPFGGSGTTVAAAIRNNRQFIAMDIRSSQIDLMKRRVKQARGRKGFAF